jgi:hypothetical protein
MIEGYQLSQALAVMDEKELDNAVEAAEIELAKENREKQKAMRHRRVVRSF